MDSCGTGVASGQALKLTEKVQDLRALDGRSCCLVQHLVNSFKLGQPGNRFHVALQYQHSLDY
jgi:hypothetical protein